MRIAGVYASAFFIELAEYFIFLFFKLLCVYENEKQFFIYVQKRETVIIASPGSSFGSDYPRHLK